MKFLVRINLSNLSHLNQTNLSEKSAIEHKLNKPNGKVPIHLQVIGLYSEYIFYIVVAYKSFDFSWNMFNTRAINICHTFAIEINAI